MSHDQRSYKLQTWKEAVEANSVYYSNVLELIALLESDVDSQLELKKATDNVGSIL